MVFAVIVATIIYVLPTFKPELWPHKQINLGLDLQGGMHLVLEVDTFKAVEGQVERILEEIRDRLRKEQLRKVTLDRIDANRISAKIENAEALDKFNAILKEDFDFLERKPKSASLALVQLRSRLSLTAVLLLRRVRTCRIRPQGQPPGLSAPA